MVIGVSDCTLLAQGAEARLFKAKYLGKSVVIKERFEKKYRHTELDVRLTKERIKGEARSIVRAKMAGVCTPALYLVDFNRRSIFMEYVENAVVLKKFIEECIANNDCGKLMDVITNGLGKVIAKLHSKGIIHGDLTTSNILLKTPSAFAEKTPDNVLDQLVVIDFGLSKTEFTAEDAAVDLYVLERSLISAHSELPQLFGNIYAHYQKHFSNKSQLNDIVNKYEDVRARGRKRCMVG